MWTRRRAVFTYFLLKPYAKYVFERKVIEHFGFYQFYTDNCLVQQKDTCVIVLWGTQIEAESCQHRIFWQRNYIRILRTKG